MHFRSTFCQEQPGQAVLFNFITLFSMKLHLCFRSLVPHRADFMAGVGGWARSHTSQTQEIKCKWEYNLKAMRAESVMDRLMGDSFFFFF